MRSKWQQNGILFFGTSYKKAIVEFKEVKPMAFPPAKSQGKIRQLKNPKAWVT